MTVSATAEQLNNNYIQLPLGKPFAKLSMSILQVIGEVYSFTGKDKSGKQLSCYRSYERFEERCGVGRATVARAIKIGRSEGLIKGDRKDGFTCLIKSAEDEYLRLPQWAITDEFQVRENEKRRFKPSERKVYAFLFTRCTSHKNGKHIFIGSNKSIAKVVGLSERTVQRALWTLIRARLIYRNSKTDKGINRYKSSRYALNYKLVLAKEKNVKKIRKEAEKELRKASEAKPAEPFPEFTCAKEGEEEFVLHNRKIKTATNSKQTTSKIHIPEIEKYQVPGTRLIDMEYDFSGVSDEELQSLYDLYSPLIGYLNAISEGFVTIVRFELKDRKACGGGSPP